VTKDAEEKKKAARRSSRSIEGKEKVAGPVDYDIVFTARPWLGKQKGTLDGTKTAQQTKKRGAHRSDRWRTSVPTRHENAVRGLTQTEKKGPERRMRAAGDAWAETAAAPWNSKPRYVARTSYRLADNTTKGEGCAH